MQRLLMGEVGSGKTVVALVRDAARGRARACRRALMAPTETLAEQHFATLQALMPGEAVAGRAADRLDARRRGAPTSSASSASGELSLVVGTHALIEDDRRLRPPRGRGRRRAAPLRRAPARARSTRKAPDGPRAARPAHDRDADPAHAARCSATATSTSRRCASCRSGRRPIETHVARRRARARARLRAHPRGAARRAARRSSSARSSRSPRRCRRAPRPPSTSACATTRVRATSASSCCTARCARARSRRRWRRFAAGEADVLVATTVIEVGIDVPNATVMLVEDAERYGISPAAPAARAGRARRARVAVPAVRARSESRAAAGARRAPRRLRAGRDRPRAARRGRADRHAPVRPRARSASRGCPRTATLLERARAARASARSTPTPSSPRPSTRCSRDALRAALRRDERARRSRREA